MVKGERSVDYDGLRSALAGLNILHGIDGSVLYRAPFPDRVLRVGVLGVVYEYDLQDLVYLCAGNYGLQLQEAGSCVESFFMWDLDFVEVVE